MDFRLSLQGLPKEVQENGGRIISTHDEAGKFMRQTS